MKHLLKKNFNNKILIEFIKEKYQNNSEFNLKKQKIMLSVGNLISIDYKIFEGDKERIQNYEGLIISIKNKGLSKTIKIRRIVQGIGVEQTFFLYSSKILSINIKKKYKVRRSKLFFISKNPEKLKFLKIQKVK